jgi:hypothetical protein
MAKKETLTQTVWVKIPYTNEQKIEFADAMVQADSMINDKHDELKAIQDDYKEQIKVLEVAFHDAALKYKKGYDEVKKDCIPTYEGNIVRYADKDTGEIVEEREMTEAEQLRLSAKLIDAEEVIRQSHKEE